VTAGRDLATWAARLPRWQLVVLTVFAVAVLAAAAVNALASDAMSRRAVHVVIGLVDVGLLAVLVRGYRER
jgi:hypothetical protein